MSAAFFLFLFLPDPVAELEHFQKGLFERIAPSVVFLSSPSGFGSGFFVAADTILTNRHVIEKADAVDVILRDGTRTQGVVLERAEGEVDLALIKLGRAMGRALPLDDVRDVRVGSWVASVGHGRGAIWTFNTGMVSNIYPEGSNRPVFQTQIPLNPGNSGGPIVNRLGRVVGIVTAGLSDSNSINFAIKTDVALRTLRRMAALCDCLTVTAPPGVAVFLDGQWVGSGPKVVLPVSSGKHEIFAVVAGQMRKVRVGFPERRHVDLSSP